VGKSVEFDIDSTKRLYLDEVQFINREIEKNSHEGFIFSKFEQQEGRLSLKNKEKR